MIGKVFKAYLAGAVIGSAICTFMEVNDSSDYEEKHKDKYARSTREWKREYVTDKLAYNFTRIAAYPITASIIVFSDRVVQNRLDRKRYLEELEEYRTDNPDTADNNIHREKLDKLYSTYYST